MLTLTGGRRISAFTVFRDSIYDGEQRIFTPTFYALPDAPRLATDAAGGPAFDFLWYRTPPDAAANGAGGLVTLTVELAPTDDERTQLEQGIAAAFADEPLGTIQVLPVPFRDGTVALAFAGESANGDFAAHVAGSGPARLAGWQRGTFAVTMTRDGAALLWQAIDNGAATFEVRYDLVFEAHLADVRLRVWCDVRSSLEVAADRLAGEALDPAALRQTLTSQGLAGTELLSEEPLPPDDEETLARLGQDLLDAALRSALFEANGSGNGSPPRLRPYAVEMETSLNHTFTQSFPVERHAVLDGLIRLDGGTQALGSRVRRLDLDGGFFRVMEVKVYCTVDFAQDPIDTVKATMVYEATGSSGPVRRSTELVFGEGTPVQTFRFDLAAPDQRTYRYDVDVYYRGVPPARLSFAPTDATAVVLDLDGLGLLRVEVELRDVPFEVVGSVVVDLRHAASGAAKRLILDGRRLSDRWDAVVGEAPGPYSYAVAWVTDSGRIEQPWAESTMRRLQLDAPPELRRTGSVQLVSAGDFSQLAQILVELRTGPDDGSPASFAFTGAGQTQTWQPRTADPVGLRYEVKTTVEYSDGSRQEPEWRADDRPVFVVRDVLRFDVTVIARLLDVLDTATLALVDLAFDDDQAGIHERRTLAISDRAEEPHWSFRLGAPERHTYRHQLTVVAPDGSRKPFGWREAQDSILVLRADEE
jgi:hypothetical protein